MKHLRPGLLAVAILLASAVPAWAAPASHGLSGTLGAASSVPANPYPISGPTDVAIDNSTHDIYVTDPGNHRIEKFDSAGNFLLMFGSHVDKTTGGSVCTASSGDICQAGASSSLAGGFENPNVLAVDNSGGPSAGDVYVGDNGTNLVSKFTSGGQLVTGWGPGGTKDGSDAFDRPTPVFAPNITGVAVAPNGDLLISAQRGTFEVFQEVWTYRQDGTYISPTSGTGSVCGSPWLKIGPFGYRYFTSRSPCGNQEFAVELQRPAPTGEATNPESFEVTSDYPTLGFEFDPLNGELYQVVGTRENQFNEVVHELRIDHYGPDCDGTVAACVPVDTFGEGQLDNTETAGVAVDGASHSVLVADAPKNAVLVFGDLRPVAVTEPGSGETSSSVILNAHVDPAGRGEVTDCRFEYGFDRSYGSEAPCSPDATSQPFVGPTEVASEISGLSAGSAIHYRVVATNASGRTALGADRTVNTTQAPTINAAAATKLTPTTADLEARVNPNGLETTYRFEYGSTTSYGTVAPVPAGILPASDMEQHFTVHLQGLTQGIVYHYRLIATNANGTTTTGDQTFNFYPPPCPNATVRQQTQANFLPECRAYELVTPENANGTQIYADGPNTGYATSPSRLSFVGLFGTISSAGGKPINSSGDLYVSTRTDSGWVTRYVGLAADKAQLDGGPAMGPPGSRPSEQFNDASAILSSGGYFIRNQNGVITNSQMSRFLTFNLGTERGGETGVNVNASNAPYVIAADGSTVDRWPTNLNTVPSGDYGAYPKGGPGVVENDAGETPVAAPGGSHALDCPTVITPTLFSHHTNFCPGDVTASADLGHFVFATEWNTFAPGGRLSSPGSIYDNDTNSDTVSVASQLSNGEPIPEEPGDESGDPLQIPAVSKDGSHILMAAGGTGPCGSAKCLPSPCLEPPGHANRCPLQPSHLYIRVDDGLTYDVSQGHEVDYVGMSGNGSKVYFTSPEQITTEDEDASVDLYVWNESSDSITLVSKGNNGNGNSDSCKGGLETNTGTLSTKCDVTTYTQWFYCTTGRSPGGNCLSDDFIAPESGDIYFFSPEQLDGTHGIDNQQNLYVYRGGQVHYVTTLTGAPFCYSSFAGTECTRLERMQVSANGNFMSFLTSNRVAQSQYENAGHMEMYTYEAQTGRIVCVSCVPSGAPPVSNTVASQDGLFMDNAGHVFFSTEDALVSSDTNQSEDVYEYVEGRPQLITPGTGDTVHAAGSGIPGLSTTLETAGLIGVSANGRDVYFGTFQTLVPADHNGNFYKIYDARTSGGFPSLPPPLPCNAADECHGAGSSPDSTPTNGTSADLGSSGNVTQGQAKRHRPEKHRKGKKHHGRHLRIARGHGGASR